MTIRRLRAGAPYVVLCGGLVLLAFHATLSALAVRHMPSLERLALAHLARMGERALPFVMEFLGAHDPRLKQAGASLLKAVGESSDWSETSPELLKTVVAEFRKGADPVLKRQLAAALGASGTREAVEALGEGARDPAIRESCVQALGTIAERAPNAALKEAARQAGAYAGSAEAARAVSSAVDTAGAVARPVLGVVDAVLGVAGSAKTTATTR
jgi:hypothetical protein